MGVTNKDYFETLMDMVEFARDNGYRMLNRDVEFSGINDFLERQLKSYENRVASYARRKALKDEAAPPDELLDIVYSTLTNDLQTSFEIIEKVANMGINATDQRIRSRLTKLIRQGKAVKEKVLAENDESETTNRNTRMICAYRLI